MYTMNSNCAISSLQGNIFYSHFISLVFPSFLYCIVSPIYCIQYVHSIAYTVKDSVFLFHFDDFHLYVLLQIEVRGSDPDAECICTLYVQYSMRHWWSLFWSCVMIRVDSFGFAKYETVRKMSLFHRVSTFFSFYSMMK